MEATTIDLPNENPCTAVDLQYRVCFETNSNTTVSESQKPVFCRMTANT